MTITEILNTIHEERVEFEIYKALHSWMLNDRQDWIDRAMESEATVRAVGKIANNSKNKSAALEGITNLCSEQ
jgi:hypothetical protein